DLIAIGAGRYNTMDLIAEKFIGGNGTTRFLNIAQNAPLTNARTVPAVSNGATFAWIKGGQPFVTFAILDPNDSSTTLGLKNLYGDGITFVPGNTFPSKFFKKSGHHSFGATVTTKLFTPFDQIRKLILPFPPIIPVQRKGGSWSLTYTFDQYIVERSPKNGWGLFGQASVADERTSPVSTFINFGLGGNGLFKSRPT